MTAAVESVVSDFLAQYPVKHITLAYSGGLDSTVLLHALAQVFPKNNISAAHVHHGLLAEADDWVMHSQKFAKALGIGFAVHYADLQPQAGDSVEALARQARYHYFMSLVSQPGHALLTAHHADDQAETLLLNALRGSGVKGLAAMPECKAFGSGWHLRPLLNLTRQELRDYAQQHQLRWVEDPSNQDDRFNRNYLRQHIMPMLQQRWPQMATTLARSAFLIADSDALNQDLAVIDAGTLSTGPLALTAIQHLSQRRRFNVLRYWLGLCLPQQASRAVLLQIDAMLDAVTDANPEVQIGDKVIRRFQGHLYCCELTAFDQNTVYDWPITEVLQLSKPAVCLDPKDLGHLYEPLLAQQACLQIRFRQGGERIQLPGRTHQHQVKKLLQERGVPPWLREQLPMVFYQDCLIAILGLSPPVLGQIR